MVDCAQFDDKNESIPHAHNEGGVDSTTAASCATIEHIQHAASQEH